VSGGLLAGAEGVCGRLKERKSFPFGFLGLFQERGAASPFLLQEGERQLNREREGNGTVCVGKWGEGRRPQWQRGALWFFKGRVGQLGFLCLWPSEGDGRRLAKKEIYLGLGCFFWLPFPPVKNFLPP